MQEADKVPYSPSQTKRFEVSKDSFSRERIRVAYSVLHEIRGMHPFVVGGVVFGSLSKGKVLTGETAPKTDVDLVIFVDLNLAKDGENGLTPENEKWVAACDFMRDEPGKYAWGLPADLRFEESVGLYMDSLFNEKFIVGLSPDNQLPDKYNWGLYIKSISLSGDDSILETLRKARGYVDYKNPEAMSKLMGESIVPLSNVALPWGLDMLGGLKKYKQAFLLNDLAQLSLEERDKYWKLIMSIVKHFEKRLPTPPAIKKSYPETYDEAVIYYCK